MTLGLLIVTTIYWPGLSGPFLVDDKSNVIPAQAASLHWQELAPVLLGNNSGSLGRPVSVLSFTLTNYFHGLDTHSLKYDNLMLHLINGLLLFWLGGRLLSALHGPRGQKPDQAKLHYLWVIAGIAAFLWLIHPLMVSTVLYIVQRMTLLAALFTLLSLLSYVVGRQRMVTQPIRGLGVMALGTMVFGLLAVLSKENGVLIPFYILAIEFFIFRFKTTGQMEQKALRGFHGLFVAAPIVGGLSYFLANTQNLLHGYDIRDFDLSERIMTEAQVLWFYIKLILLPRLAELSLFHDAYPVTRAFDLSTLFALSGLLALLIISFWWRRRAPLLGLGICWFIASHLLESTVFPLELVFEHRNYLAAFGLIFPIAYYLPRCVASLGKRKLALSALYLALASVLAFMTSVRAQTWSDLDLLVNVTLKEHPMSVRARTEAANIELNRGDLLKAREHLEIAIAGSPSKAGSLLHMLSTYCRDEYLPKGLLEEATNALEHERISAYALTALDMMIKLYKQDRCPAMLGKALTTLTGAIIQNQYLPGYYKFIAHLHNGRALKAAGQTVQAAMAYKVANEYGEFAALSRRAMPLLELLDMQIASGQFDDVVDTVNQLRIMKEKHLIQIPNLPNITIGTPSSTSPSN